MFLYPGQRHIAPEIAVRISWSLGFGFSSSRARAVISIPGVQKPHCSAWRSWKPCCTGSSCPFRCSDSTVRISCPSHIAARAVHDFTGLPSMSTTHAPQFDVSQPQCVPVRSSVSRRKCTSSMRGSMSCDTCSPLTFIETLMSGLLVVRACHRPAQRTPGQNAREVALVVDRPAAIGAGRAVLGSDLVRLREQLVARRLAAQELLGPREVDGREADGAECDAHVADEPVVHPHGCRRGRDCPV